MSSREIADRTDKRHPDVMRDIRVLISNNAIDQSNFAEISLPDSYGRLQPAFMLDFKATMVLTTGYDAKRKTAVVDRWMQLEEERATPVQQFHIPQTMAEALRLAADLSEQNQIKWARPC